MASLVCCGFECGIAKSDLHWGSLLNASFSTSTVRSGARSLRVNPSNAEAGTITGFTSTSRQLVARFYLRFASLPTTNSMLVTHNGGSYPGLYFQSSDSKLYAGKTNVFGVGATGVSVTTGVWYRIDMHIVSSANPWTVDLAVDGVACGQQTLATAAADLGALLLGNLNSELETYDLFVDDLWIKDDSASYPIGAGKVEHFVPTADGAHNVAGINDFERTLTGTDIDNTTTTAFQLVDDVPLEAVMTDWINMVAPPGATEYVEVIVGPAPGVSAPTTAPRAVEVICGINQAGTGTGNMEIRLNDNGTTDVVYTATGVAGVAVATGQQFKRKHYAAGPAGAWVIGGGGNGDFTDLRIRFGSPGAVDANPDQYFGCAMIEAEFAEVVAGRTTKNTRAFPLGRRAGMGFRISP